MRRSRNSGAARSAPSKPRCAPPPPNFARCCVRNERLMYTCDQCRELIWDDLFGLLEAGDSANLRRHVAACDTCQAEMATALAQQQLVAEAARIDAAIPR